MLEDLLQHIDASRRDFVKKLVAAGAAAPIVATFSIQALAQIPANSISGSGSSYYSGSASSYSGSGSGSAGGDACQTDLGYAGPERFSAHLAYGGRATDVGARANGEMRLLVERGSEHGDGHHGHDRAEERSVRAVRVRTHLVDGVVFGSAQIVIGGSVAVNLPTADYRFEAADVMPGFCDLDFVLNAIASGQATVVAAVNYLGTALNLVGPIAPGGFREFGGWRR